MSHAVIHVMHVLTDTNVGGAGTLLCNQLACIDQSRFRFSLILPRGSRLAKRIRALSLPCSVYTVRRAADRSADLHAVPEYLRLFRALRPDVVHTHAALAARVAARLARVPVCLHTRHCVFPPTPFQRTALYRLAFRTVNRLLSDGTVAVAHAAAQQLRDLGMQPCDIRVIINGVQPLRRSSPDEVAALRHRLQFPEDAFVVGMVARLEDYKGQGLLLEAAARCLAREDGGRIYLLLCGDGSQREALREQATRLGITPRMRMVGFCEDIAPFYALMDVNVNASFGTETSSLALSEGMSLGVPAVASDFGGNPHMIHDGYNGLLFPSKDAAALAEALLRLVRAPDLLRTLGQNARSFYQNNLTAHNMTAQLEDYYTTLLRRARDH